MNVAIACGGAMGGECGTQGGNHCTHIIMECVRVAKVLRDTTCEQICVHGQSNSHGNAC